MMKIHTLKIYEAPNLFISKNNINLMVESALQWRDIMVRIFLLHYVSNPVSIILEEPTGLSVKIKRNHLNSIIKIR